MLLLVLALCEASLLGFPVTRFVTRHVGWFGVGNDTYSASDGDGDGVGVAKSDGDGDGVGVAKNRAVSAQLERRRRRDAAVEEEKDLQAGWYGQGDGQ